MVNEGKPVACGVAKAHLGMTQGSTCAPDVSASGQYELCLDPNTLRFGAKKGYLTGIGSFLKTDLGTAVYDPRRALKDTIDAASDESRFAVRIGV